MEFGGLGQEASDGCSLYFEHNPPTSPPLVGRGTLTPEAFSMPPSKRMFNTQKNILVSRYP